MPIQRYRCIVPFSYQDLSLHWHDEVEFTWIEGGSIDYGINFETYRVRKDDLLLISPHTLHSAHALKKEEMISESLVFHLDMLGYQTPDACTIKYISPLLKGKYRFVPIIRAGCPGAWGSCCSVSGKCLHVWRIRIILRWRSGKCRRA